MPGILLRWVISAGGLLLIGHLFEGIEVRSVGWAFLAALFLGIFNALIRPVVFLLTLPINIVTLGLFTFVINGLMLWLVGGLLAGFAVHGFWPAVGGAVVLGLLNMAINAIMGDRGGQQRRVNVTWFAYGPRRPGGHPGPGGPGEPKGPGPQSRPPREIDQGEAYDMDQDSDGNYQVRR